MINFGGEDAMTAEDFLPKNSGENARNVSKGDNAPMDDVILYHGSREGINGEIRPDVGRINCDFGRGFYMGEIPDQAKGLVIDSDYPFFYELTFKLSEIPRNRILELDGEDWIKVVLANRKNNESFNELKTVKRLLAELENYDVIIGKIADDRMNVAMQRFMDNLLTDKGLIACLQFVDYGKQYVAKTEFACSKIKIINEPLELKKDGQEKEVKRIVEYSSMKRNEGRTIVDEMGSKYYGDGKRLIDIIAEEKSIEKKGWYGK